MFSGAIKDFKRFRPLLYELVSRDIKNKYRRSALGVLWTLLNPLFMMIILSIVFSNIFTGITDGVENYPIYILCGQVLYNFYSESTQAAMNSIVINAPLIKKVYVPKYMFALSRVISCAINIFAAFAALLVVMVIMRVDLHYTIFLSVIPMLIMIIFSLGIGLILAALSVQYRDIVHLYSVFLTGFVYLAPIVYPLEMLNGWVRRLVLLNPVTNILTMFRGFVINNAMPDLYTVVMAVVPSVLIFMLGIWVFYKKQDDFILYV